LPRASSVTLKFGTRKYNFGVAVLQCEVCGSHIVGKPQRVVIEGARMLTCAKCAELGSGFWEPESEGLKHPKKGGLRATSVSLPAKKKVSASVSEDLAVVENFGILVRQARERLGLSHEDLGRKIGEKASVISKIESEKMAPDQKLSAKLQHVLRVRLVAPLPEPRTPLPSSVPSKGVTLGEMVILKSRGKKEAPEERRQS